MLVAHVEVAEKAVVPLHSHPHEQGGTVLSGEVEFTINGQTQVVKAGGSYIIPGGAAHKAVGLKASTLFEIFCPVREEYKF
jgi:quercetin dioxygenase-like cupin family protein